MRQFLVLNNYASLTSNSPIACYSIQGSTALHWKSQLYLCSFFAALTFVHLLETQSASRICYLAVS